MAERVGFEPTVRYSRTAVFKTAALNHSATSPYEVKTTYTISLTLGKYKFIAVALILLFLKPLLLYPAIAHIVWQ